ncbi:MAG: hypothetical protein M3O15_13265 [Acidobacteriota bacterium]|nr:hypothetical protein [Acidobacteriota bacterium]
MDTLEGQSGKYGVAKLLDEIAEDWLPRPREQGISEEARRYRLRQAALRVVRAVHLSKQRRLASGEQGC